VGRTLAAAEEEREFADNLTPKYFYQPRIIGLYQKKYKKARKLD
jgi:hypothetical protein